MNIVKFCCAVTASSTILLFLVRELVMKKRILQRGIVLFLLIFALSDITSANPCGDELGIFPLEKIDVCKAASPFTIPAPQGFTETVFKNQDAEHEHSQNNETNCEDCFCCCSHILPSSHFSPSPLEIQVQITDLNKLFLPAAPPRNTFRPPRLV
jgi:hypothetical protein